jgi:hypothetical protein
MGEEDLRLLHQSSGRELVQDLICGFFCRVDALQYISISNVQSSHLLNFKKKKKVSLVGLVFLSGYR